jgi:serine/threonine protein kinase
VVYLKEWFMHKSVEAKTKQKLTNMCLVFEPLGKSLYDFIKDNKYKGFDISDVREIARQSLKAIEFLHSIRLTHTDLKPENILLKSDKHEVVTDETKIPRVS